MSITHWLRCQAELVKLALEKHVSPWMAIAMALVDAANNSNTGVATDRVTGLWGTNDFETHRQSIEVGVSRVNDRY